MNVAIIGCGYVGMALILFLAKKGYFITAVTSSRKKLKLLNNIAQKTIISSAKDETELFQLIDNNDLIILNLNLEKPEEYENQYLSLAKLIKQTAIKINFPKMLIYTSSSAVYGDHGGRWVDEEAPLHPFTEEDKLLIETEKTILNIVETAGWNICVFRLAEVYGPGHEISDIIKNLKDHTLPGKGQNFTNMVHLNDILAAINYAITHKLSGIYNLADDDHPTRKELYDKVCEKMHLSPVKWNPLHVRLHHGNKRISNHKIKAAGYSFLSPKRLLA